MAELRWDADGRMSQSFAGDTFNTAVYANRMLPAGQVAFYSKIGHDPLSKGFVEMMAAEGLDPANLNFVQNRNLGIYSVTTDQTGERSFHYWRNQSAARCLFDGSDEGSALPAADIIYVSGITLAILPPKSRQALMAYLRSSPGLVAYDSNYRPKLWEDAQTARQASREMWAICDIALPSIDDELALFGDENEEAVVDRLGRENMAVCVIKRGHRGPISTRQMPSLPEFEPAASVIDTTSAGDSFNGGFLAAYIQGKPLDKCMLAGHNLAAKVVGVRGAIAPRGLI